VLTGLVARASDATLFRGTSSCNPQGGALLADCGVARRSLWIHIALSSLLAFGQNRLRHGVQIWSNSGLVFLGQCNPPSARIARLANDQTAVSRLYG
jgi:hypothetical protein